MLRHDVFPAASWARTVTVLEPTSSGICAVHCVVPAAVPDPPVLVAHVIAVTPTLSLAVPLTTIEVAAVEITADEEEVIASCGGVVSLVGVEGEGVEGAF